MNRMMIPRAALIVLVVILAAALAQWGCGKRIKGEAYENQKPVVYFVNIPPDSSATSRNPIMYWIGNDPDGQVKSFRYIVIKDTMLTRGYVTPEQYVESELPDVPSSEWTYLSVVVDPTPNPQTSHTVKMSASLTDPVNEFVPQYVFLQAIDDQGLGSDIVWRLMRRNDNPPETYFSAVDYNESSNPFINDTAKGGLITGLRLSWYGTDPIDYPTDPPAFQYQWKLFGPYTWDSATQSGEYKQVISKYTSRVFVTNDGKVFRQGHGDSILYYCDSVDTSAEPDTFVHYPCVKLFIDTIRKANTYGHLDTMFLVDDSAFQADTLQPSGLYRLVDTSEGDNGWISNTSDTLVNVYRYFHQDKPKTVQMRFIFWIRSRDDANVADMVPEYGPLGVIEPKHERSVLVIDFTKLTLSQRVNAPRIGQYYYYTDDTGYNYFYRTLHNWWNDCHPSEDTLVFDSTDYVYINQLGDDIQLRMILQHQVCVAYNDDANASNWYGTAGISKGPLKIYRAIDAGVNVWFLMRAPFVGAPELGPMDFYPERDRSDYLFTYYFPLTKARYTGWSWFGDPGQEMRSPYRIEDFSGAISLQPTKWPDVKVDSANLHRRYWWGNPPDWDNPGGGNLRYIDTLPYLPEVGWVVRRYGTEAMYLYKSRWGTGTHPLGVEYTYAGTPVAFRYSTNQFRTALFAFTPLGMQDSTMQVVIDTVMNFLYPRQTGAAVAGTDRYQGAPNRVLPSEIRRNEQDRMMILNSLNGVDPKSTVNGK